MFKWLPYPFIRILLVFIIGIVAGDFFVNSNLNPAVIIIVLLVIFIIISQLKISNKANYLGFVAFIIISLLGYHNYISRIPPVELTEHEYFIATISDYPEVKEKNIRYEVEVNSIADETKTWKSVDNKALLYISNFEPLEYGDVIIVKGSLRDVNPPRNPNEFDYKQFLFYKGITSHGFVSKDDYHKIGENAGWYIIELAFKLRKSIETSIDAYYSEDVAPILKALLVGIRGEMDDELQTSYAAAGAIHVLAVSGLHVGIVYMILVWIIGGLKKSKQGKYFFAVIALAVLWFYAFVTGFSPSILRAVLMFSFVIIGQAINRGANIYNSIAASAFILLLINPMLLMNVGFQLSYMAVIGIIYFYPRIVRLFEPDNIIVERIWQMTVIGVAAQITTLPLSLYYFHQFPTYFFISNLIVIPAATLILSTGLIFLVVQWWEWLARFVVEINTFFIEAMNYAVRGIENLPMSTVNSVFISPIELTVLFLIIVLLVIMNSRKSIRTFWLFCILTFIFLGGRIVQENSNSHIKKIQVYAVNNGTVIDFIDGHTFYSYGNDKEHQFSISAHRQRHHATVLPFPEDLQLKYDGNDILIWKGKKIGILGDNQQSFPIGDMDFILIENNALKDFELLKARNSATMVMLGNTNSYYYKRSVHRFAEENNIPVFDLNESAVEIKI